MSDEDLTNSLLTSSSRCSAKDAEKHVPKNRFGYYAIFVDCDHGFLEPYAECLRHQECGNLLYIGIAKRSSLFKRLVQQDLRHNSPSSFFRSLGAVLGYRPKPGSLAAMKNKSNYKFSDTDTHKIQDWINRHVSVRWMCVGTALKSEEQRMIEAKHPLLNITYNSKALPELKGLRDHCRQIARQA